MLDKKNMMKVAFYTLGCKVNYTDTEALAGLFRQDGFVIVPFKENPDIYVINTCSVTHASDAKSRQLIRKTKRANPNSMVVVTGCYAQVAPQELAGLNEIDLIWGTRERHLLPAAVKEGFDKKVEVKPFPLGIKARENSVSWDPLPWNPHQGRTRAFLKIQEGCQKYCTYCIVPYARGPLRSLPPEKALATASQMVANGYKEIVLTGVHLGQYGAELGKMDLTDILKEMVALKGLFRIRLSSLEPVEITGNLVELIKTNPVICRHLHVPLQSGDDEILKKMNRPYTGAHFIMLINYLKQQLPDIALTTDVMVGFPGEGEEEFSNTMDVVEQSGFARLHVFKYSPRKGTPAATMKGQVPSTIKEKRSKELMALGDKGEQQFRNSLKGKTKKVLFEGKEGSYLEGLTEHYIKVKAYAPQGKRGEVWLTKLIGNKKEYMTGEIINRIK